MFIRPHLQVEPIMSRTQEAAARIAGDRHRFLVLPASVAESCPCGYDALPTPSQKHVGFALMVVADDGEMAQIGNWPTPGSALSAVKHFVRENGICEWIVRSETDQILAQSRRSSCF